MPTKYPDQDAVKRLQQEIQQCGEPDYKASYAKMSPSGVTRHQFARIWFATKSNSQQAEQSKGELKREFHKTPEQAVAAKVQKPESKE